MALREGVSGLIDYIFCLKTGWDLYSENTILTVSKTSREILDRNLYVLLKSTYVPSIQLQVNICPQHTTTSQHMSPAYKYKIVDGVGGVLYDQSTRDKVNVGLS